MNIAVVQPAAIIEYASADELADAQRFVEELTEFGDDDAEWSIGMVCSIRPNKLVDTTNIKFIERIHRLARSLRQLQRQAFEAEVEISTVYRKTDGAITECRLTVRWPRRPLVLELPQKPCAPKAGRGTSHTDRKRNRAA